MNGGSNGAKVLGSNFGKHGSMKRERRERAMKGRQTIRTLKRVMNVRNVSMKVKYNKYY